MARSERGRRQVGRPGLAGAAVAVAAVAGLSACASSGTTAGNAASRSATSGVVSIGPLGSTSPPGRVRLGFADKGRTLRVPRGTVLELRLNSTYWTIAPVSDPRVLGATAPVVTPDPNRRRPPGMGVGTVVEVLQSRAPGRAVVRASRVACGEAMPCPQGQGSFAVTVVVT